MNASLPIKTLVPAGALLALSVVRELSLWASFALGIALLILIPWSVYSMARLVIKPAERRSRAIRLAIWIAVLVGSLSIRAHWDTSAREDASAAASAIQAYKARTGYYPSSLSDVGLDPDKLRQKISLKYRVHEGHATLFYSQPSVPTMARHYNFESKSWGQRD